MKDEIISALTNKVGELTLEKIRLEIENANLKNQLAHSIPARTIPLSTTDLIKIMEELK